MGGTTKLPLEAAEIIAAAFIHHLSPYAERIEVAGSIRRKKPEVGDIEIVMIPKLHQDKDMFGEVCGPMLTSYDEGIASYIRCETPLRLNDSEPERKPALERLNNGERYLKLYETVNEVQIDLFIVLPPAQWGPIISIRTGSAEYSKRLVTALKVKDLRCEDGRVLTKDNNQIDCPNEIDFFRACGMKMIDPVKR
jgi:DNA polymerase/3'-5' exonuclease PolX